MKKNAINMERQYAIDCGGDGGEGLSPDSFFTGGNALASTYPIENHFGYPQTMQSIRFGDRFLYTFSVFPGTYSVTLYFAEQYVAQAGGRLFDVRVNGSYALRSYDIFAAAGAINRGVRVDLRYYTCLDGLLEIEFTGVIDTALVNNLKVDVQNYLVNCGSALSAGAMSADRDYTDGGWGHQGDSIVLETSAPVQMNMGFPTGMRSARAGCDFSYRFDFPDDSLCTVKLYFAELEQLSAGQRVFDVAINGMVVLPAFDISAQAGGAGQGIARVFDGIEVVGGAVTVSFYALTGEACINGIQLERDSTAPSPAFIDWSVPPHALGETSISMEGQTAQDPSGVEYFFENMTDPQHSSGWLDGPVYTDTGLTPSTKYRYRLCARDKSPNQNQTHWSTVRELYTAGAQARLVSPVRPEVTPNVTLRWLAGDGAQSHDVYVGTDPVAVAAADHSSPLWKGNQLATEYSMDGSIIEAGVFYWRIDEIGQAVTPGQLWSFAYQPWRSARFRQWGTAALAAIENELRISSYDNYYSDSDRAVWSFQWGNLLVLWAQAKAAGLIPDQYAPLLENFFVGMDTYYWDEITNQIGGYQSHTANVKPDPYARFYDDNSWSALALLNAYAVTGQEHYRARALDCITFDLSGEDQVFGGGVWWKEGWSDNDPMMCKPAVASSSTALACLRYYEISHDAFYLEAAQRLINWTLERFLDPADRLVTDALYEDLSYDYTKWTYNTGFVISSLLGLHRATGQPDYLDKAIEMARQAEMRWIQPGGAIADPVCFGIILADAYMELYQQTHDTHWLGIVAQALEALHGHLDTDGHSPELWTTDASGTQLTLRNVLWDASAAFAFLRAAELEARPMGTPQAIPYAFLSATAATTDWASISQTVNGAGLTGLTHSTSWEDMWTGALVPSGTSPSPGIIPPGANWIQVTFALVYRLGQIYIWNDNQTYFTERGIRRAALYGRVDAQWRFMGEHTLTKGAGTPSMPYGNRIDWQGLPVDSLVILPLQAGGTWGDNEYLGLSELRFGLFDVDANDTSDQIQYGLGWEYQDGLTSGEYQNDLHVASQTGAFFEYGFAGGSLRLLGSMGPGMGKIHFYLDDFFIFETDCSAPSYLPQQVLCELVQLDPSFHILRGIVVGPGSVSVDRIIVE